MPFQLDLSAELMPSTPGRSVFCIQSKVKLLRDTERNVSCLCPAGMVGYGMAKAAVHQLCQSLAAKNSGMPPGAAAVAILP